MKWIITVIIFVSLDVNVKADSAEKEKKYDERNKAVRRVTREAEKCELAKLFTNNKNWLL